MKNDSKLVKNTVIYGIGNLGSKILAYIMVLVYSYYITPDDLGYYDIVLTTISMIQPVVIFQINDGVFRFLVDSKKDIQSDVIGASIKFLCFTTIITEVIYMIFCLFYNPQYAFWIALLLCSTMFFVLFQDIIRGLGKNKEYALYGVLNSIAMLIFEVVGLMVLKLGVKALIISKVFSYSICIVLMFYNYQEIRESIKNRLNYNILKKMLKYSGPLVPNTICWWVVNSSDRYIILLFLGPAYNGIYSMSTKFPTILTTITSIFYLAWQETAIKEYHSQERDKFYSDIFKKYYTLLFSLCLCAIPITKIVIELFVSDLYTSSWQYTGFLYLGATFGALCSFLGMGYQISKETNRSVVTTIFAAFVNFAINILCIKMIGLQAASLSTFIAYLFLLIIRVKHSKRYFRLNVNWIEFISYLVISIIYIIAILYINPIWFSIILEVFALVILLKKNTSIIQPYVNKLMKNR